MQKRVCGALAAVWLLAAAMRPAAAQDARIDRIFSPWDAPSSPGCALAVVRNGHTAYARGYGSANLELRAPITTRTVFDIGSVSKQFTAMSIVLLAQDGKLSLDDDIHKYVGELPDYGTPLSLRQMLHHMSGLPSYTDLFDLAGVPEADLSTDDDALALIARQRTLNVAPGRQYLYSDTNYFLLALVVRRVTGTSLRQFAQQRIFGPLGMRSTHFHDDHTMIVPQRATGYAPRPDGGFAIDMSNFEELGDGAVMTTVEDMVRWDGNFRHPLVGGPAAIALLEEAGVRTDGSRSPYAMGQILDEYRGHARIQHTGEWVGYRAAYLRYPQDRLSVILLCNVVGELDALALAERVTDRYLGTASPPGLTSSSAPPQRFAGQYWNPQTLAYLRFTASAGALLLEGSDGREPLRRLSETAFGGAASSTRFEFHEDAGGMHVLARSDDGDPVLLERVDTGREPPGPVDASARAQTYAGTYCSADLGLAWTLDVHDGVLRRRQWLFPAQTLHPAFGEVFTGDLSEGTYVMHFTRTGAGVDGFSVATTMVRPLRFERCPMAAGPATRVPAPGSTAGITGK